MTQSIEHPSSACAQDSASPPGFCDKPRPSPELASRLRRLVFEIEPLLLDTKLAVAGLYGLALGLHEGRVPPDLAGAGFVHFGRDLSDRLDGLHDDWRDLFSLVVRNSLPENDPERQKEREAADV